MLFEFFFGLVMVVLEILDHFASPQKIMEKRRQMLSEEFESSDYRQAELFEQEDEETLGLLGEPDEDW